jgi:prepilin-type N-terminal cleavage/methylation domain-containing protein
VTSPRTPRRAGFTLVEMLTVVALFGLVTIYVGRILFVNERAYHTVENTSESQQNLRVVGEFIEDNLRHAGMMVPRFAAVCGRDATNGPDVLYVSDAAALDVAATEIKPYSGVTATGATNLTTGTPFGSDVTLTLASMIVEPSPNRPAYDTNGDGVKDSDFREDGGVIVYDRSNTGRGNACGRIKTVDLANSRITVNGAAAMAAAGTATLVAVPANEYFVNGTNLLWNGIQLADGVEDFQVAYVRDANGNNVVDDPNDRRGFGDANSANYTSSGFAGNQMREVAVGLVSRARIADPLFSGQPQALFNRAAITTADGFRRRTFQTRVMLRNLATREDS